MRRRDFLSALAAPLVGAGYLSRTLSWNRLIMAEEHFYNALVPVCAELKKSDARVVSVGLIQGVHLAETRFKDLTRAFKDFRRWF